MKENADLILRGDHVDLIPYRKEHVEKYHEWMKDPFLQEMTASEPLTIEEEYAMQQEWMEDSEKCTFIIANRVFVDNKLTWDIIGDVNLFLSEDDGHKIAEVEIMIAESSARGQGKGIESTRIMMSYGFQHLGITMFQVKISMKNESSIKLFQDKLDFQEISRSSVFQEITFELDPSKNQKFQHPYKILSFSEENNK